MTEGTVGILNVGAGDIALSFSSDDPAESIRAARIVKDMLRRGYALLVEVERGGEKRFERALDFNEKTNRYIVADFNPLEARRVDIEDETQEAWDEAAKQRRAEEKAYGESIAPQSAPSAEGAQPPGSESADAGKKRGRKRKEIDAGSTRAVAVGRSAGG